MKFTGGLLSWLALSLPAGAAPAKLTKFTGMLVYQENNFYLRTESRRWTIDATNLTASRQKLLSHFTGEDVELRGVNDGGLIRLPGGSSAGFRLHYGGETLRIMPGLVTYLGQLRSLGKGPETFVQLQMDEFKGVRLQLAGSLLKTEDFRAFRARFQNPHHRFLIRGTLTDPRELSIRSITALPLTGRFASELPPEAPILTAGRIYKHKAEPGKPARYAFHDELSRTFEVEANFRPPVNMRVVVTGVHTAQNRLRLESRGDVTPAKTECEAAF